MVVDYRALNKQTVRKVFLIPNSDEVKSCVAGSRFISVGDLKEGFNQCDNEPGTAEKMAVTSVSGCYLPRGLTFGPTNGPEDFQELVFIIFAERLYKEHFLFLDDLSIATGRRRARMSEASGAHDVIGSLGVSSNRCETDEEKGAAGLTASGTGASRSPSAHWWPSPKDRNRKQHALNGNSWRLATKSEEESGHGVLVGVYRVEVQGVLRALPNEFCPCFSWNRQVLASFAPLAGVFRNLKSKGYSGCPRFSLGAVLAPISQTQYLLQGWGLLPYHIVAYRKDASAVERAVREYYGSQEASFARLVRDEQWGAWRIYDGALPVRVPPHSGAPSSLGPDGKPRYGPRREKLFLVEIDDDTVESLRERLLLRPVAAPRMRGRFLLCYEGLSDGISADEERAGFKFEGPATEMPFEFRASQWFSERPSFDAFSVAFSADSPRSVWIPAAQAESFSDMVEEETKGATPQISCVRLSMGSEAAGNPSVEEVGDLSLPGGGASSRSPRATRERA